MSVSRGERLRRAAPTTALAALSWIPLLLTKPGVLGSDTKVYLYLDPGRLLRDAPYMWDPGVGYGTVTHQNIGYLFPIGPYYWLAETLGVPDWIAQRVWVGAIIFAAGAGVRFLLRTIRWTGPGVTVASFAYAMSPYLVHYVYKHSVILLPFAALPWMIGLTALSLRRRGWAAPAAFALVCLTAGGINATSLILVGVGPVLWVLRSVFVEREISARKAVAPVARLGSLTLLTSLWWMAGLRTQGAYGFDVLRATETYKTVATASSAAEIWRGLGYWFLYGGDALGSWFQAGVRYTQSPAAIALSFAVPGLAVVGYVFTRWRDRAFFVVMGAAGLVLSVASFPFDNPSPFGSLFKAFTTTSSGLALRSTPRAAPLLALSVAVGLGAAIAAVGAWRPRVRPALAFGAIVLVVANQSVLFTGGFVDPYLSWQGELPDYWTDALDHVDEGGTSTRFSEVPGRDFAYFRWGYPVDNFSSGVTDRPQAGRELVPYGTTASVAFANALDEPFQTSSFNNSGYADLMRLTATGTVVVRNDVEFERFRSPHPEALASWFTGAPGLVNRRDFGVDVPNNAVDSAPLIDEIHLGSTARLDDPPAVQTYEVSDPREILRTVSADDPTIVSGDARGLIALADAGGLDVDRIVRFSGNVSATESDLSAATGHGAHVVLTDTNRKAALRWGATRDNEGATEMIDEAPLKDDPTDFRLDLFGRGTDTQSVAEQAGPARVVASDYGNELTYTPADRAAAAFDGRADTAWKVGAFADVIGEFIRIDFDEATTFDSLRVLQPQRYVNRFITEVEMTTSDGGHRRLHLPDESRTAPGAVIELGEAVTTRSLTLSVAATQLGVPPTFRGLSGVGFAELDLLSDGTDLPLDIVETVRMPIDLAEAGSPRLNDDLTVALRRRRTNPAEPTTDSPERTIRRTFTLPHARTAAGAGFARLDTSLSDDRLDELLGVEAAPGLPEMTASSSTRLAGNASDRASKALDGDSSTYWQSGMGPVGPQSIVVRSAAPQLIDSPRLEIVADGEHSVPTSAHLVLDGVAGPTSDLVAVGEPRRGRQRVEFASDPTRGVRTARTVELVIDGWSTVAFPEWLTKAPITTPVAVSEFDPSSASSAAWTMTAASELDRSCRKLVTLRSAAPAAAQSLSFRIAGSTGDAEVGTPLPMTPCDSSKIRLGAGSTQLAAADGTATGWHVDELTLHSPRAPLASVVNDTAPPHLRWSRSSPTHLSGRLSSASGGASTTADDDAPFWLVFSESFSDGWELTSGGRSLGRPELVNGFANGWLVRPSQIADGEIELSWTPQRSVGIALVLSALGAVLCLILALRGPWRGAPARVPVEPRVIQPLDLDGRPVSRRAQLLLATASAIVFGVTVAWWAAPVGVLAAALATRTAKGLVALRVAIVACFAVMAAFVVVQQFRHHYELHFGWPRKFMAVHSLGMTAMALLCLDSVVELIRADWRRDADLLDEGP